MSEVLVVTGPAGAGKTTTCERFANAAPGIWAFVSQDGVRQFIKAGFKNPSTGWDDETERQWNLSIGICADLAKKYQNDNINCVIDCFAPKGSFEQWEKAFEGVKYRVVVLLPDVEETVRRNNERVGDAKLNESQVREHHDWHAAWKDDARAHIIDTTNLKLEDVVQAIKQTININQAQTE